MDRRDRLKRVAEVEIGQRLDADRFVEDLEFADRFEARRVAGHLAVAKVKNIVQAEQDRIERILARDRLDRVSEALRGEAEIEVAEGVYANLDETALGPTPEQFAQARLSGAEFDKFTPRGLNGTSRTLTAYRRRDLPQVSRMVLNGTIDGEGFRVCVWYRNLVEGTGLTGNIGSIDYGREVFAPPEARMPFSEAQLDRQEILRQVHRLIDRDLRALLDKVVLHDVPIWRAVRSIGRYSRRPHEAFAAAVDELGEARASAQSET